MGITVVVYVIALVTVEIYKFRLNISAVILTTEIRNLLFKRWVNYADSGRRYYYQERILAVNIFSKLFTVVSFFS